MKEPVVFRQSSRDQPDEGSIHNSPSDPNWVEALVDVFCDETLYHLFTLDEGFELHLLLYPIKVVLMAALYSIQCGFC